jgi:hypothetical protein
MTKEEKLFIEQLEVGFKNLQAEESEKADYRMQNYYNCVDDYSWGGLSDQASNERLNKARRRVDLYKEQISNGGYLYYTIYATCLYDLDGNFITDNVVNTKFGQAFLFNGTFVSVAKKMETYNKKGYTVKNRVRDYKLKFSGRFTKSGNLIYDEIHITKEEIKDFDVFATKNYIDWLIENDFKNNI